MWLRILLLVMDGGGSHAQIENYLKKSPFNVTSMKKKYFYFFNLTLLVLGGGGKICHVTQNLVKSVILFMTNNNNDKVLIKNKLFTNKEVKTET